jgi:hypothetical protein
MKSSLKAKESGSHRFRKAVEFADPGVEFLSLNGLDGFRIK